MTHFLEVLYEFQGLLIFYAGLGLYALISPSLLRRLTRVDHYVLTDPNGNEAKIDVVAALSPDEKNRLIATKVREMQDLQRAKMDEALAPALKS